MSDESISQQLNNLEGKLRELKMDNVKDDLKKYHAEFGKHHDFLSKFCLSDDLEKTLSRMREAKSYIDNYARTINPEKKQQSTNSLDIIKNQILKD